MDNNLLCFFIEAIMHHITQSKNFTCNFLSCILTKLFCFYSIYIILFSCCHVQKKCYHRKQIENIITKNLYKHAKQPQLLKTEQKL